MKLRCLYQLPDCLRETQERGCFTSKTAGIWQHINVHSTHWLHLLLELNFSIQPLAQEFVASSNGGCFRIIATNLS